VWCVYCTSLNYLLWNILFCSSFTNNNVKCGSLLYKWWVLLSWQAALCCSMIIVLLASLAFYTTGYYAALAWMSLSIAFFLVCSFIWFSTSPQLYQSVDGYLSQQHFLNSDTSSQLERATFDTYRFETAKMIVVKSGALDYIRETKLHSKFCENPFMGGMKYNTFVTYFIKFLETRLKTRLIDGFWCK